MEGRIEKKTPSYFSFTGLSYRGEVFRLLSQLPDTSNFRNGVFVFKPSRLNIEYMLVNFPKAKWIGEAEEEAIKTIQFRTNELKIHSLKQANELEGCNCELEVCDYKFKTKPFEHQRKAFNISKDLSEYGLFFEQGCGKTKVIIDNARHLFDKGEIQTLVVVAPNGVHSNWVNDELPIHMPGEYKAMAWQSSFGKAKKVKWDELKKQTCLKVFAFNVECFASDKGKEELTSILESMPCLLAIDESQKIKNPSAKRTKFITKKASPLAKYRRILTGTPITKGAEDFYSQFLFLNPKIIGLTSYFAFKNRYCVMGGFQFKQITSYKNVDELQEKVKLYSTRVLKKDCLDLPKKIYQFAPFDLTPEQTTLIKQIKKEGIASIEKGELILSNAMAKLTKIQQISRGYLYETETGTIHTIVQPNKNPALLKLKEILDQIESKVLIWAKYRQDIALISSILPKDSYLIYDGSVSSDQREVNKKRFQEDESIRYFLLNEQAGATGLTLTAASYSIYFTNTYDLEIRQQSEDRNHRIGTVSNVTYIDLVANKTHDKKIINTLKAKKSVSDLILEDPTSLFLEEE